MALVGRPGSGPSLGPGRTIWPIEILSHLKSKNPKTDSATLIVTWVGLGRPIRFWVLLGFFYVTNIYIYLYIYIYQQLILLF